MGRVVMFCRLGLVNSAEAISLAAVVVAAISAAGSLYAIVVSRKQGKTKAKLTVEHKTGIIRDVGIGIEPTMCYQLGISVSNTGQTTEYVNALSVERVNGEPANFPTDNAELKAHSGWSTTINITGLSDLGDGFVVAARFANGVELRSPVEHLKTELSEKVEQYNAGSAD